MAAAPFKQIKDTEYTGACRYTGYIDRTIKLTLECGHVQYRKASQRLPINGKARCKECAVTPDMSTDL